MPLHQLVPISLFAACCAGLLGCSLLYGEFLCHLSAYWRWPRPPEGEDWRRMLLVADPQLVGLRDEPGWPLGTLTRWDADRYLSTTFGWALAHAGKVEVVAFLGDLIDEGSTTDYGPDYQSYVARFRSVYPSGSADCFVYVGGDNDVGGEGAGDPVTGAKVDRFRTFFPERRLTVLPRGLRLVTHNVMTMELDRQDPEWSLNTLEGGNASLTFLLSHVPLISPYMR